MKNAVTLVPEVVAHTQLVALPNTHLFADVPLDTQVIHFLAAILYQLHLLLLKESTHATLHLVE